MLHRHGERSGSVDILSNSHEDFIQIIDHIKNKENISPYHLALFIELMDYLAVEKAFVNLYIPWLEIHKVFRPSVTDFEIFRKEAAMKYCPFYII